MSSMLTPDGRHVRARRDALPTARLRNPNAVRPLPESPYLCPVCGDSHLRGVAGQAGLPLVITCGNEHTYWLPGEGEARNG